MDFVTFTDQDVGDNDVASNNTLSSAFLPMHIEDHVRWQSSQKCEVLNHLLASPNTRSERTSSRRVPEPYNRMSSINNTTSAVAQQNHDTSESSFSESVRRNFARSRYIGSGSNSPQSSPKTTTSDPVSAMPFFDQRNPSRFFAVLKGVSARVDENAGVTKRPIAGTDHLAASARCHKKRRPLSLVDMPTAKRACVDVLREKTRHNNAIPIVEGKGKARAQDNVEDVFLKPANLQGQRSMPDVILDLGVQNLDCDIAMDVGDLPEVSFTSSQMTMPPPPGITKEESGSFCSPPTLTILPPLACNTERKPNVSKAKADVIPQLHPFFSPNSSSKPTSAPCIKPPTHQALPHLSCHETRAVMKAGRPHGPLASLPETGQIKSRARPPQLGMRRAHTLPGHSTLGFKGKLPMTQKPFKPPSRSQQNPKHVEMPSLAPLEMNSSCRTSLDSSTKSSTHRSSELSCSSTPPVGSDHTKSPLDDPSRESTPEDPDSSFGEMSFDMDALEETMKKYD